MEEKPFWEEEQQSDWWYVAWVVVLIVFLVARNRIIAIQQEEINTYILENISAETQTWNGIVVGKTTQLEAEERVFGLEYVKKSSIDMVQTNTYTFINWSWRTSPNNVNSSIRCKDGVVDRIILTLADELTVGSIITQFGFPDEVSVSPVGESTEDLFWNQTLNYLAEGINVSAYARILQRTFSPEDEVESIELYQPETITSAQGLALAYGIDIQDIVMILPSWLPTKDKQLFESYLELFRNNKQIPYGPQGIYETSGLELGLFIAENEIKILRDGTTYDSNGTLIECPAKSYGCTFRTSEDPNQNQHIFVNGLQAASILFHAGTVSHEAFHLSLPFDSLQNSLYEELTAITVGYLISDGENRDIYMIAPPDDLTSSYEKIDLVDYVSGYCGDDCAYITLPTYPDGWENLLEGVETD